MTQIEKKIKNENTNHLSLRKSNFFLKIIKYVNTKLGLDGNYVNEEDILVPEKLLGNLFKEKMLLHSMFGWKQLVCSLRAQIIYS